MTWDTIFPNIWEIQPPVFSFQRQVWAVYPAGQLLELAEAELRASLERNIDVLRRAWHLEVPIPQLTTSSDGFLGVVFFILSSLFTGLHISLYIICCLVKSVGKVFDSSKPMQWNTMIWWVLCWLPVFLVGAGGFTLWWASSVVFTCRKPIWRSTSSSRSLCDLMEENIMVYDAKTEPKTWCFVESWWNSHVLRFGSLGRCEVQCFSVSFARTPRWSLERLQC